MRANSIWDELEKEAGAGNGSGILKRLISPESFVTVFLGMHHPSLRRLLLVEIPKSLIPSADRIPRSKGFECSFTLTGDESEGNITLVLSSTEVVFNEVFSAMVENLSRLICKCTEHRHSVRAVLEGLARWQNFLEKNRVEGLNEEAQRGLFGELVFIRMHLLSDPSIFHSRMAAWTGSKSRQHDFQFGKVAVEVKTSSAKQNQRLYVSSEQQLDETNLDALFLFHLSLSIIENHPDTLPALINSIRNTLQGMPTVEVVFNDALVERGYLDTQEWRYANVGYAIRESNVFRVSGDFPRLTESDLPLGVGDLKYSISVAECKKHLVTIEELLSLLP